MEDHTTKFNNVHTQLLLQMQIDSNIQEMKEKLLSTQNSLKSTQSELQATKTSLLTTENELLATKITLDKTQNKLEKTKIKLNATQNELQTTKDELKATQFKFEQTMEELNRAKEDATKRENEIKFLQENIKSKIVNGFKLNHQITEIFAKRNIYKMNLNEIFESLETKQPIIPVSSIQPFEINGTYLEFPNINKLVQNLNKAYNISYKEKHETLLKKMKNEEIYHIDGKQLIFKLNLPKNHRRLYIKHLDHIALSATEHAKYVVVKNNLLLLLDNPYNDNNYEIYLQIPNYNNESSHCFLYRKNKNGDKLLLKYSALNDVNMDDYKTPSNEVLFHITK